MYQYKLSKQENQALNKIISDTRNEYIRIKEKRASIVSFCELDDIEAYEMIELGSLFYKKELIRFAEPYLNKKEYEIFKKAVYNAENIDDFKRFLHSKQNYNYKLLLKVLKRIGGLFNEC